MDINLENFKKIHFIGIGGISMSGLAHILLEAGYSITGSDIKNSHIIEKLIKEGAKINIPHDETSVNGADLVVYTAAVHDDNIEFKKAKQLNIPIIDRATLLGIIMKKYKYSIAVAGSHGKTTTTSLISVLLDDAGFDPTVLIGGEVDVIGGNVKVGHSEYFVTEACEYTDSFLKFYPYIAVILNVDSDHLDYFKNIENIKQSFTQFANLVPPDGFIIACNDDENTLCVLKGVDKNIITYGIEKDSDWKAENITFDNNGCPSFSAYYKGKFAADIKLSIVGKHNVYNALATLAVGNILGININETSKYLTKFKGTHRRFEQKGIINKITIVDDYAHHPTEIKATLASAKNFPHKRIIAVFQPHTYSRTKSLLYDFAESFDNADKIVITDIYAARENDTGIVSSKDLADLIRLRGKDVIYIKDLPDVLEYLKSNAKEGDLILTIGAGNVYEIGEQFLKTYKKAVGA